MVGRKQDRKDSFKSQATLIIAYASIFSTKYEYVEFSLYDVASISPSVSVSLAARYPSNQNDGNREQEAIISPASLKHF